jgi:N-acetylglucosaminyl-diphospho-decaprenol L-rhamnosyltransferase
MTMAVPPDLSIIVVVHNGRELALRTLESARGRLGAIRAEWLVVDCGSSDGVSQAIEARWSDVTVLRRANIGFAAGNNAALAQAGGRYVLLLNPDVEILEGTLAELVSALDERPEVGAASVVQRAPSGAVLPSIRRFPSPLRQLGEALGLGSVAGLRESDMAGWERERSADWLVGAFLAVRRSAMQEIGLLDERFFLYSEETDWCLRLRRAGWDVRHLPQLEVVHHQGGYAQPELAAQLTFSKLLFARKHYGPLRSAGIRAALALRHLLRAPLFTALSVAIPRWRPRAHGERRALSIALGIGPTPRLAPAPHSFDAVHGGIA